MALRIGRVCWLVLIPTFQGFKSEYDALIGSGCRCPVAGPAVIRNVVPVTAVVAASAVVKL